MTYTSDFLGASNYAVENKLEGKYVSQNDNSSFNVVKEDDNYKVINVVLNNMTDLFTIDTESKNSVESFVELETARYNQFVEKVKEDTKKYIGSTMQRGLSLQDLLEYLEYNWQVKHNPLDKFTGKVEDRKLVYKVNKLNSEISVPEVVYNEGIIDDAIQNTLGLEGKPLQEREVVEGIMNYLQTNHEDESISVKVDLANELVAIVNSAIY